METLQELRSQWANPSDILSLLLLIGGDTVQKAIAQLVGRSFFTFGNSNLSFGVAPVAFSFGWVAYGFSNLLSVVGKGKLMPTVDSPSTIVNCANAFSRENQSWALGRLLRDHEMMNEVDPSNPPGGRAESIRIDIFELGPPSQPSLDYVWWLGWISIVIQIGVGIVTWVVYGDWGVMTVVICGNSLALFTTSLPQWNQEKWAGRITNSESVFCLTRGNGSLHVMVFICPPGSWNLETLATGISRPRPETPFISLVLCVLWVCILITVSGLKAHAWYLVFVGGIGMLQNVHAAGVSRDSSTSRFHLKPFHRKPTIIGKRQKVPDDVDSDVNLAEAEADISVYPPKHQGPISAPKQEPKWLESMDQLDGAPLWLAANKNDQEIANVHGALMELEKWVPTAGLAMLQTFFPAGLRYEDDNIRDNIHKKFWKRAYHTKTIRKAQAEYTRRQITRRVKEMENNESKLGTKLSFTEV